MADLLQRRHQLSSNLTLKASQQREVFLVKHFTAFFVLFFGTFEFFVIDEGLTSWAKT